MKYLAYKDLMNSLIPLMQCGGNYRNAAEKVYSIIGKINSNQTIEDPFHGVPLTNHGENRVEHCIKYDLSGHTRLITIQDNGVVFLCFTGKHQDCEDWLNKNRGLRLSVDGSNQITVLNKSEDIHESEKRINAESDFSAGLLYRKMGDRYYDAISENVKRSILIEFEKLTSVATEDEILELACKIEDAGKQNVFFDVFTLLKKSDIDGVKKRIDLYKNSRFTLEYLSTAEVEKLVTGEDVIDLNDLDNEVIAHLMKTMNYMQWMIFRHPDQNKIVEEDFSGPAKLMGVSGSGKTVVVVHRAVRLAKKYKEKILILTLNRSLAKLLDELVTAVCPENYRGYISVKSYWELCRDYLQRLEPYNTRLYDDLTWRTKEHIDEIWSEFYLCENNNYDAKILMHVHKTLLTRKVYPFEYIKQELDWIRSALAIKDRADYLSIERKGRSEPFDKSFRELLLRGLSGWEEKMKFVGVIDYLGLTTALLKHTDHLTPEYRCILIDEEQDFGTIELSIIRKLVAEGENDLFITGDIAQRVSIKHHVYQKAGIVLGGRIKKILKNYRNSREILDSAYRILEANVAADKMNDSDFELLNPEYANFSTNRPLILRASHFKYELGTAINYFNNKLSDNQKACISICGLSLSNVKKLGELLKINVLDGSTSLNNSKIFLSDLEQTKGFEFDSVCILNCNNQIIPNPALPEEEWYYDVCKLYVAMTRAKTELIISYSEQLSEIFKGFEDYFVHSDWSEHEALQQIAELPKFNEYSTSLKEELLKMTGEEFLYTKKAIGLSHELQNKLCTLITGKNKSVDGKPVEWKSIEDALNATNIPNIAQLFGAQKTWGEFNSLFEK